MFTKHPAPWQHSSCSGVQSHRPTNDCHGAERNASACWFYLQADNAAGRTRAATRPHPWTAKSWFGCRGCIQCGGFAGARRPIIQHATSGFISHDGALSGVSIRPKVVSSGSIAPPVTHIQVETIGRARYFVPVELRRCGHLRQMIDKVGQTLVLFGERIDKKVEMPSLPVQISSLRPRMKILSRTEVTSPGARQ